MSNINEQIEKMNEQIEQLQNKKKKLMPKQEKLMRLIGTSKAELRRTAWADVANKYLTENEIAECRINEKNVAAFLNQTSANPPLPHQPAVCCNN